MKKGITPIIAIIILLLITMALAATAWMFLSGFLDTLVGQSFILPPNSAVCSAGGTISVFMTNTGQNAITPNNDINVVTMDGVDCSTGICDDGDGATTDPTIIKSANTIESGKLGLAVTINSVGSGTSHRITIGIAATNGQIDVMCP